MKRFLIATIVAGPLLIAPALVFAQSACGDVPVSAECPTGSTMTCDTSSGAPQWVCAPDPQPASSAPVTDPAPAPAAAPAQSAPTMATTAAPAPAPTGDPAPTIFVPSATTVPPTTQPPPTTDTAASAPEPMLYDAVAPTAPSVLPSWLSVLIGAAGMLMAMLGIQGVGKQMAKSGKKPCKCCGGQGYERMIAVCSTCNGTKLVQKDVEGTIECSHCEGSGEDVCHDCEGEGKVEDKRCETCAGTGKKAKDAKGNAPKCCKCLGKGEVSGTLSANVPCPDCT